MLADFRQWRRACKGAIEGADPAARRRCLKLCAYYSPGDAASKGSGSNRFPAEPAGRIDGVAALNYTSNETRAWSRLRLLAYGSGEDRKNEAMRVNEIKPSFPAGWATHQEVMYSIRLFGRYVTPHFRAKERPAFAAAKSPVAGN